MLSSHPEHKTSLKHDTSRFPALPLAAAPRFIRCFKPQVREFSIKQTHFRQVFWLASLGATAFPQIISSIVTMLLLQHQHLIVVVKLTAAALLGICTRFPFHQFITPAKNRGNAPTPENAMLNYRLFLNSTRDLTIFDGTSRLSNIS